MNSMCASSSIGCTMAKGPQIVLRASSSVILFALLALLNQQHQTPEIKKINESSLRRESDQFVWSSTGGQWALMGDDAHESVAISAPQVDPRECVWPEDNCSIASDRIINQLLLSETHQDDKFFKIALANDLSHPLGQQVFLRDKCRVNKCLITHNLSEADAIVWPNSDVPGELAAEFTPGRSRSSQIWIAYLLESPPNTYDKRFKRRHRGVHQFNWTASYRSDSDIVTPYSKFVPHSNAPASIDRSVREQIDEHFKLASEKHKEIVRGKGGAARVAWFVSNCYAHNERLEFARELGRFVQVDIYGKCGNLTCIKSNHSECLAHLNSNYKFYLSFENSNNREYITEKLYRNAYGYNDQDHLLLPIVMGPPRADYERLVPPGSFIHVDEFTSARELAGYLHELNEDHALYYSYFQWKTMGRFIETKFLCRTCAMLHNRSRRDKVKSYANIQEWWWHDEH